MNWTSKRIGVLMGGWSAEREVSLNSGANVVEALKQNGLSASANVIDNAQGLLDTLGEIDLAFNCLHGGFGENGGLQAMLDVLNVAYTGSGMLACALAMNKVRAKQCFKQAGLNVPDHEPGLPPDSKNFSAWLQALPRKLGWPIVVKPVSEGSSLGVNIAHCAQELARACEWVHQEFGAYFVERFVSGKEITAGVLWMNGLHHALPLLELDPANEFYDYEAKYTQGATQFIVPAKLNADTSDSVKRMAVLAHESLGCFGYSRVDFRVTGAGAPYVLEVNTSPGMTNTSDLPQVAQAAGIAFNELVHHMLRSTHKPHTQRPLQTQV